MSRKLGGLAVAMCVGVLAVAGAARAQEALEPGRFDPSLKGLTFGIGKDALVDFLKKRIAARFDKEWAETKDVREQDRISREKAEGLAAVGKDWTAFDGKRSGWDASVLKDEFAHNLGEEMLHEREGEAHVYYFFTKGALYKVIRTTGARPAATLLNDLKNVYGAPSKTSTDAAAKGAFKDASWRAGMLSLVLADHAKDFQCSAVRWALAEADAAVQAEWSKARAPKVDLNPLVEESKGTGRDEVDPVDAMIGSAPAKPPAPAADRKKPAKGKPAPKK